MTCETIKNLILCGGGMRCIAMLGVFEYLEENNLLANIEKLGGTSAGGVLCFLLNIGYTSSELKKSLFAQHTDILLNNYISSIYHLFKNYGIFTGDRLMVYITDLVIAKGFSQDITFLELYEKTGKMLVLTATSISERKMLFFSFKTFPDMKILQAIRISISIPILFTSKTLMIDDKIHYVCDGGIWNNFPLYYFENEIKIDYHLQFGFRKKNCVEELTELQETLGILLLSPGYNESIDNYYNGYSSIVNIKDYLFNLAETISTRLDMANFYDPIISGEEKYFFKQTIGIKLPHDITILTDLNDNQKEQLIKLGKESAIVYFKVESGSSPTVEPEIIPE